MTVDQLTQYLSWALYVVVFVVTGLRAVRRPLRANVDTALLFLCPTIIIGLGLASALGLFTPNAVSNAFNTSMLLVMFYMLLRLVNDFSDTPRLVLRASEVVLALLVIGTWLYPPPRPAWLTSLQLLYPVALLVYSTVAFMRESARSNGVTRRRMRAVAAGSVSLCALFLLAGLVLLLPGVQGLSGPLTDIASLASGVFYYIGFATPAVLRRSWQEPELRAFLQKAASLPRLRDTPSIIAELERGAATSLGAPNASIGLWDPNSHMLQFTVSAHRYPIDPAKSVAGRTFLRQEPAFSEDVQRDSPAYADQASVRSARALLAAPITAGEKRLGVLTVYAPRPPVFAEEDLSLVKLLGDQAAVILESRALIDEASRVRAREEAARMKEDFLSAAAHDLKTPLTTLVALSDLLERKALRNPNAPADIEGLRKVKLETRRLSDLVLELLDAARAEQGRLVGELEETELVAAAREVCARYDSPHHRCTVDAGGPLTGLYDAHRVAQLLENLVENAVKYSPDGGPVVVKLWQEHNESTWNHITVKDSGIGIPEADMPRVFDRFHRGSNVDDRRFAGMGLGLFICNGIVAQHGGRIWVERATPGKGGPALSSGTASRSDKEDGASGSNRNTYATNLNSGGTVAAGINDTRGNTGGRGTIFHVVLPAIPVHASTTSALSAIQALPVPSKAE